MKRTVSLICIIALMSTCFCTACGSGTNAESTSQAESTGQEEPVSQDSLSESESETSQADQNTETAAFEAPIIENVSSVETISVPLYMEDAETVSEIELAVVNDIKDVPYISLESMAETLGKYADKEKWEGFAIDVTTDGNTIYWLRDNNSMVSFDFDTDTITFSNADLFFRYPSDTITMDVSSPELANEDGEVRLFNGTQYFYRAGDALSYDLGSYNINMFTEDGTGYIPLQTFSDAFLSGFQLFSLYNGQCEIITSDNMTEQNIVDGTVQTAYTALGEIYYSAENGSKSDELTTFNYQELCMALDNMYGLMEEHDIDSFDDLFRDSGLILRLQSNDANDTYYAMSQLTTGYFGDRHSRAADNSYMVPADQQSEALENTSAYMFNEMRSMPAVWARKEYYPDGITGYEEVGNTAYITFDHFVMDDNRDYYNTEITNNPNDVVELLIYANSQITRENSPIENVVLDISENGGGSVNVALCVMSWFCGYAEFSLTNVKTGSQSDNVYKFDVNLDHQIDANDSLCSILKRKMDLNLYCLIGEGSFSCGNLVPAFFKNSALVTLIGHTSGGGACSVQPMSTADGCTYQISSRIRINVYKNGSFYSVDEGVTPDVYIDKYEHMYDRTYLTDLINNLD